MLSRRTVLRGGMGAAMLGIMGRRTFGIGPGAPGGPGGFGSSGGPASKIAIPPSADPFLTLPDSPPSVMVDGLPFQKWFTGDSFPNDAIPFHGDAHCFNGTPPPPSEDVAVAVVGGGISGLATAYLLRDHDPVLLELHSRFGGAAQGELWSGTRYSLGNAYLITPDPGTFLEDFYQQLGLPDVVRVDDGPIETELDGEIVDIFDTAGQPPDVQAAFAQYAAVVSNMANVDYPEIPLPKDKDNQWILDLDRKTLREDIEEQMGVAVPPALAAAIQAYCYSSFSAGWEEISAAAGWNFLAAEEFGRWVFPGGNAWTAHKLWEKLNANQLGAGGNSRLRAGHNVVDVRLAPNDRVQVTYTTPEGDCRSLLARRVAMCCPKVPAKHIIHDLTSIDSEKHGVMTALKHRAYVVVNVLLNSPVELDFYDIFLLGDQPFPMNEEEAQLNSRVVDMLSGHFARDANIPRSVLTLYWPLPFDFGRWTIYHEDAWRNYAESLVPQIKNMLELLDVSPTRVKQVRMTRWGHAMPVPRPGLIADGIAEALRRPIEDRIYFINQDNWALPAIENCLLDAEIYVPQIEAGL